MKKVFLSFALIAASLVATAATVISPTQEVNYRTDNGEAPTKWSVCKTAAESEQFELKWSARFFAAQQWAIPNISKANQLDIYYSRVSGQTNDGTIAAWPFPYEVLTENTFSKEEGSFLDHVKTIFGVYPGDGNDIPNSPLVSSIAGTDSVSGHARILTFDATSITALKSAGRISNDTLYVNILLTTLRSVNDLNYKYYSIGAQSGVINYMVVSEPQASYAVDNINQGKGYSTLAAAVAAAAENDTLIINENVEIAGNRLETNVPLTIMGKTGTEKILRATGLNNITILPKKVLTLKNLILDGQNVDLDKPAIEAGSALVTLDNVTVQNFKRTNGQQGLITIKSSGSVKLINTTFTSNAVAEGSGDVFLGFNKHITLTGDNVIPNGIFIEKSDAIDEDNATHTVAIDVIVAADRTVGAETPLVNNCTDVTKYNLVAANADWELVAGETYLYIKDNGSTTALKQTLNTKHQTQKLLQNGQLLIRHGETLYNVLGTKY